MVAAASFVEDDSLSSILFSYFYSAINWLKSRIKLR